MKNRPEDSNLLSSRVKKQKEARLAASWHGDCIKRGGGKKLKGGTSSGSKMSDRDEQASKKERGGQISISRLNAIAAVTNYRATAPALDFSKTPASEIFGANVFDDRVMHARLPKGVLQATRRKFDQAEKLVGLVADEAVWAVRDRAIGKAATPYAHEVYLCS